MTRKDADEILGYVAQEILSPMAFDNRPANKVWEELTSTKFNTLCHIVNSKITIDK